MKRTSCSRGRNHPLSMNTIPKAYGPVLRLWTLRLIGLGGGVTAEHHGRLDICSAAFETAGLQELDGLRNPSPAERKAAESVFRKALRTADAASPSLPDNTPLARNLVWLGKAAGLSAHDLIILHLILLSLHHAGLENALDQVGGLSLNSLHHLLSKLLGLRRSAVAKSLDPAGPLTKAGLIWVDTNTNFPFRGKVEVLPGLADRMSKCYQDSWELFRGSFIRAPEPTLAIAHYPHAAKDLTILEAYLKLALQSKRQGVNILIHGTPGTGKTELVRTLSAKVGAQLYEVASENQRGGPVEGYDRFRGYRLAQSVLANRGNHLIFFDEIEDVFRPGDEGSRYPRSNVSGIKAWINKVLEDNPVPAFWVTNHLHILDNAFVRRFDYVLQLDNPPRSVRRRMLEENLGDLPVGEGCKDHLAEHEGLSPALIDRVSRVVRTIHPLLGCKDAGPTLSHILGNSLEALGMARNSSHSVEVVTDYRPELVNTNWDLSSALEGLRKHRNGRLCFFGPPGTGKTAYGRYLAKELDSPLLLKRGSDLLSKWVGGTEKNLAAMFEEARQEGAVLLLDEADSFLQERGKANQSWEVTQVNEMLTQMEAFDGIFIASTNLMDSLDAAALRRFDLKVRFDYLRPDQSWTMFQDAAHRLGLEIDPALKSGLSSLGALTPGDFAAVLRQARMNYPRDCRELLTRLEGECQLKPENRRRLIGFTRIA